MAGNTYRYLNSLIMEGSFSRAARALQISQPSISQFLHRIESEAGAKLIDRTARPLKLTYAGECFMQTEREIMQLEQKRRQLLADIDEGIKGHVTIGSSHYRSTFFLAEVLPVFRREFPGVTISLAEGTTMTLEDYASEGLTDFSLVIAPLYRADLTSIEIFKERYLLAVSAESRIAKAVKEAPAGTYAPLPFEWLHAEPFITTRPGQKFHILYEDLCRATGALPKVVLESESPVAALYLTSAGLGATLVTETLAKRCHLNRPVRFFSIEPAQQPRTVVAAYRKDGYLSKAAKSLIEVMKHVGATQFADG